MNATERLRAAMIASDERITFVERMTMQYNNDCVIKLILTTFVNATDIFNSTGKASKSTCGSLHGSGKVDMKYVLEDARVREVMDSLVENSFTITFLKSDDWIVDLNVPARSFRVFHGLSDAGELMTWDAMRQFLGFE